ncbi:APC family permease [Blastococcus xanthinilyticus]|uniref:Amino acid/polyamine/organocation transporter (APC superfamily) n=1 Tax=Blastococcus xanthinilyticus TaxID=1564164 RepID=A0A5S5CXJ9_9ACTN|nr:APC family permease [Blastococcus xanthinilyticus]TYP88497.1 amino acid/polyamine/organocation transporter (APC superfamily) [Blastococcus xanthinilyticus]
MSSGPRLDRRLGTGDAVVIGLGSMIGAGVFAAFGPAARAAGTGLLLGLALAAAVAYCNATASAQLAAQYPESGGTYVYGRARLGDWWGFLAGWAFVVGKTASCAAMALTFAAYAVPPAWERPAAVGAVVALVAVNYRGITRTARLTRVLLAVVLTALAVAVLAGFTGAGADAGRLVDWSAGPNGWYGVLQAAGLLFFAFAGYARIATLGEEVRDPARTIPRAIPLALGLAVATYAVVAVMLLVALGPGGIAGSDTPLADAVASWGWAAPVVRIGAAAAALGALLGLVAGIGRTGLAMARTGDLPGWLAAVHPRHRVPHHAELALGAVVCALVLLVDLRTAIGFSSFGVLLYYLVANVAAYTQDAGSRRWPRALQVAGAAGCVVLAATLPWTSVLAGILVLAAGALYRGLRLRRGRA